MVQVAWTDTVLSTEAAIRLDELELLDDELIPDFLRFIPLRRKVFFDRSDLF